MLTVFYRTVILYFVVLFFIRIMGKGELSKMSPFQMVVLFMIAELASIPIESSSSSIYTGILAVAALALLEILISFLSIKSEKLKVLFNGTPSILIDNGNINYRELFKHRITINDLVEQLRLCDVPSLSNVKYAIMESNGDLSVISNSNNNFNTPYMPCVIISDGVLYKKNLVRTKWTESTLKTYLLQNGYTNYKSIFLLFCDENSNLHIYIKDKDKGLAIHKIL